MSNSTSDVMVMMKPWLHFTGGDFLFFSSLSPTSKGAVAGACIVLFVIAIFERWVSAWKSPLEARWKLRAKQVLEQSQKLKGNASALSHPGTHDEKRPLKTIGSSASRVRRIPPFIYSIEVSRGGFKAFQAALQYILMLAVMTFQAAYIIAIIVGFGVGEMVFARLSDATGDHSH